MSRWTGVLEKPGTMTHAGYHFPRRGINGAPVWYARMPSPARVNHGTYNRIVIWDILIIGAGPAGLSAALFTRMRRMSTLLLDTAVAGGQLASLYPKKPVHDYPSYTYVMGEDLGKNFVDQANHMGAQIHEREHVTMIRRDEEQNLIRVTSTKAEHEARSVIVATGGGAVEPRKINKPGEAELKGKGLFYGMPGVEASKGKRVLIIGVGDR